MSVACNSLFLFSKEKAKEKENKLVNLFFLYKYFGPVWYMCLKIENCCLQTFVKIRVIEKVCENM